MSRFLRLSLAQSLLLVALVAFLFALGVDVWRNRSFINANQPVLALSPDGKTLAMNCSFRPLFHHRHPVILKDTAQLSAPPRMLESHGWVISDVAWSKDGQRILSTSGDHTLKIWDATTGEKLDELKEHLPSCLALSPDERFVATGAGSGKPVVKIWDLETKEKVDVLTGHKRWIWGAAFSPDGKYLATTCLDDDLKIWDTTNWKLLNSMKISSLHHNIEFTADGKLLARTHRRISNGKRSEVGLCLYDIPSGEVVDEFWIQNSYAAVSSFALSKDGRYLAAAHGGNEDKAHSAFTVWDFTTKKELATLEVDDHGNNWINALEFSLNGETLFCASDYGRVTAHQWNTGASELVFDRPAWPWKFALIGGLIWTVAWRRAPRLPYKSAIPAAG